MILRNSLLGSGPSKILLTVAELGPSVGSDLTESDLTSLGTPLIKVSVTRLHLLDCGKRGSAGSTVEAVAVSKYLQRPSPLKRFPSRSCNDTRSLYLFAKRRARLVHEGEISRHMERPDRRCQPKFPLRPSLDSLEGSSPALRSRRLDPLPHGSPASKHKPVADTYIVSQMLCAFPQFSIPIEILRPPDSPHHSSWTILPQLPAARSPLSPVVSLGCKDPTLEGKK